VNKNYAAVVVGCFCVALALALQVFVAQSVEIMSLRRELRIVQQACSIETAQSDDLAQQLMQAKAENMTLGTRQYVAGVIDTFSRPEKNSAVWHDGYDHGTATQQYADSLRNKPNYTPTAIEQ
jgi:hypothetical protein